MKIYVVLNGEGHIAEPTAAFYSYQKAYEYVYEKALRNLDVMSYYEEDGRELSEEEKEDFPSFEEWVWEHVEDDFVIDMYYIEEVDLKEETSRLT